jgi:hypothetical protein
VSDAKTCRTCRRLRYPDSNLLPCDEADAWGTCTVALTLVSIDADTCEYWAAKEAQG